MKKIGLTLVMFSSISFSQIQPSQAVVDIYGGPSFVLGEGSENLDVGFNVGAAALGPMSEIIYLGGSATFNRWAFDFPSGVDADASLHYIETSGIFRISTVPVNNASAFFQFGMGLYFGSAYLTIGGVSESDSETDFGISLCGGLKLKKFLLIPGYRHVFTEADNGTKWFSLSLGVGM